MFTTRPELAGTFGMVASTHWLASQAGMAVLEDGGNAFDAAVATAFTLHVVEPHLNGPGGDMPAIITTADDSTPTVLCGQGPAPAAATIDHYTGLGLELVPGTGFLAATVPGAVPAWLMLLRDHGTKSLADVLRFAIGYAENGHPLLSRVSATIGTVAELFTRDWTSSADVWLRDGHPPAAGALFRQPALATSYRRLVEEAVGTSREAQIDAALRAWSEGFVAEAIDEFARTEVMDDSGTPHAGLLTGGDLAGWQPSYEPAVTLDWDGWTVAKAGAWTQGPAFLQQLQLLDPDEVRSMDQATLVHTVVETTKLAFADREAWYGDAEVPLAGLLSAEYAAQRRTLVAETASMELRPGSPDGRTPRLPRFVTERRRAETTAAGVGEPTVSRSGAIGGDTCHIDVVDRWGNVISATPSGGWLQSSPTVPGLGFCLGTRAQMFWLEAGLPNSLGPGKRPRITLTPSMALRDGRPVLAFGTPGGDQQEQWQMVFWLCHAVLGLDLQAAIDAPTWHTNSFPSSFYPRQSSPGEVVVESRVGHEVVDELRRRGHRVTVSDAWSLGRMSAVARDPETGVLRAAANPRGMQGYSVGR
ncbi:MAG: gamma-glutamyltransferase family protein [Geodermatophilaceae bacterium]|nr:gamma-glutamyltransferase family protein [Geodermatophilaceae bacterium]